MSPEPNSEDLTTVLGLAGLLKPNSSILTGFSVYSRRKY